MKKIYLFNNSIIKIQILQVIRYFSHSRFLRSIGSWRCYISTTITILYIIQLTVFYLKHNISETKFCLRLQVVTTQLASVHRATLSLDRTEASVFDMASFTFLCRRGLITNEQV
jgi:hypothetical protein